MREYKLRQDNVEVIVWTGSNLGEVLKITGTHDSLSHLSMQEYKELVNKEGLKIINVGVGGNIDAAYVQIGDYIARFPNGDLEVFSPQTFNRLFNYEDRRPTEKRYTLEVVVSEDELLSTTRRNCGFSYIELIGFLEWTKRDIEKVVAGEVKLDKIKREVIVE